MNWSWIFRTQWKNRIVYTDFYVYEILICVWDLYVWMCIFGCPMWNGNKQTMLDSKQFVLWLNDTCVGFFFLLKIELSVNYLLFGSLIWRRLNAEYWKVWCDFDSSGGRWKTIKMILFLHFNHYYNTVYIRLELPFNTNMIEIILDYVLWVVPFLSVHSIYTFSFRWIPKRKTIHLWSILICPYPICSYLYIRNNSFG